MSEPIGLHVAAGFEPTVKEVDGNCAQVFLGNPFAYKSPAVNGRRADASIPTWIHGAIIINIASDNATTRHRSLERLSADLYAAAEYGAEGVVVHPGSCGRLKDGFTRWRELSSRIDPVTDGRGLLLENSAERSIAQTPEQLRRLCELTGLSACVDTAHAWSAGYDPEAFVLRVGPENVALLHANDSGTPRRSGRDRHAPPGEGELGVQRVAAAVLAAGAPAVIETHEPKSVPRLRRAIRHHLAVEKGLTTT